jgi:RNA-directed DNA polymerase
MRWDEYAVLFNDTAEKAGYDREYIESCLSYARPLYEGNLPVIYDQEHLASLVGYSKSYLLRASNRTHKFYRRFSIPKKSGGARIIAEPLPSLKEIQRWILDNILYHIEPSSSAKGFIPNRSIQDNAAPHLNQPMVLSLDIQDFFGSIKAVRVYGFYQRIGYSKQVATLLTRLCTLADSLPQGAPTSPMLSNLISLRIDHRLNGYANSQGIQYTRYADDITFSGNLRPAAIIGLVRKVLHDEGLILNEGKTRLMNRHNRQEVTGIIVNLDRIGVRRSLRRDLRKSAYYIEKQGLESHMAAIGNTRTNYPEHLLGTANFVLSVNRDDRDARKAVDIIRKLS